MKRYVVLLRGVNVGGNSKISMAELKDHLASLGFSDVATYINSGNVILASDKSPATIKNEIESALEKEFKLNGNKVLVLDKKQLQSIIDAKPKGFGDKPDTYHSDVIFLIDIDPKEAMAVFDPREGVDAVWEGKAAIYSQRLSAQRNKSRLSKIIGTKPYKSMTIRTMKTTKKLLELLEA